MVAIVVGGAGVVKAQVGLHLTALVAAEGGRRGRMVATRAAGGRERLGKQRRGARSIHTRTDLSLAAIAVGTLDDLVVLSVWNKGKRRGGVSGEHEHARLAKVQGCGAALAIGRVVLERGVVGMGRSLAWLDDNMACAVATASANSTI